MSTAFARRGYAGGAVTTTLLVDVTNATTSISAVLASTYPAANFHIVMDEGVPGFEEKIFVATRTGNNFTGCVRGEDGTSGVAHIAGATIRHILTAQDIDEANQVASVLTTKGDLAIKKAGGATTGWDRLPVGANGAPLVGRSSASLGVAYELTSAELLAALSLLYVAVPTAWTAVSFLNSWVNYAGGFQTVQYRKEGDRVYVRGMMKSGTVSAVPAFTLPVGFRPPINLGYVNATTAAGAACVVSCAASGDVDVEIGNNTLVSLNFDFSVTS